MTSDDKVEIQICANWPMSNAKRVTRDNSKNTEYGSVFVCGPLHHHVLFSMVSKQQTLEEKPLLPCHIFDIQYTDLVWLPPWICAD